MPEIFLVTQVGHLVFFGSVSWKYNWILKFSWLKYNFFHLDIFKLFQKFSSLKCNSDKTIWDKFWIIVRICSDEIHLISNIIVLLTLTQSVLIFKSWFKDSISYKTLINSSISKYAIGVSNEMNCQTLLL